MLMIVKGDPAATKRPGSFLVRRQYGAPCSKEAIDPGRVDVRDSISRGSTSRSGQASLPQFDSYGFRGLMFQGGVCPSQGWSVEFDSPRFQILHGASCSKMATCRCTAGEKGLIPLGSTIRQRSLNGQSSPLRTGKVNGRLIPLSY